MSDAAPGKNSLKTLWLLVALSVAPVAASYLLYYFWQPDHTVNYGELIEPRLLPDPALTLADGASFRLSQLKGRWTLVTIDAAACDENCERKLVYTRQLRLTQGKNMDRVERVWLLTDAVAPSPKVVTEQPGLVAARATTELLAAFPVAPGAAADYIYLVDPLGNLMMRFPRDPDPRLMIKDLARLLKASRIG
jgi:hypothetical protein